MKITRRQLRRVILNELQLLEGPLPATEAKSLGPLGWGVIAIAGAGEKSLSSIASNIWTKFDPVVGTVGKQKVDREFRDLSPKAKSAGNVAKIAKSYGVKEKAIYTLVTFKPSGEQGVALFVNPKDIEGLYNLLKKKLGTVALVKISDVKPKQAASMKYIRKGETAEEADRNALEKAIAEGGDYPVVFVAQS